MLAEYQLTLPAHDDQTAPDRACELLAGVKAETGFVPNMYARMANSPALLATYLNGQKAFRQESGFTPPEQEVVFLVISRENGCEYCMGAHSFLADVKSLLAPDITDALRNHSSIPDPKLAALAEFTRLMVASRGLPARDEVGAFLAAGYTEKQVLEIVLAIAIKTLSNYTNHLFHTPLDPLFAGRRWSETGARP